MAKLVIKDKPQIPQIPQKEVQLFLEEFGGCIQLKSKYPDAESVAVLLCFHPDGTVYTTWSEGNFWKRDKSNHIEVGRE